ncbi:MAG TPA: uridine diphosphate-N-acetylglucosamine-binding protein YvcK [Firmicutes bacterium]|nr:uridine diphosphate-N-acetylglucosamine-binding protein YvcK [Bacillota bacterium]
MKGRYRWLIPGMGVKRWIALMILGVLLFALGIIIWDFHISSPAEAKLLRLLNHYVNNVAVAAAVLVVMGIGLGCLGIRNLIRSIIEVVSPDEVEDLAEVVYRRRSLERGPRIVVIGGGTGLSTLLRGLKAYSSNVTAIVTVADDGGSSGRIREELGILPPGDVRNTLVALADTEPLMEQLFQYRFSWGEGLTGHSFGNLFIAAMTDITGDFETAIRQFSKVLAVRGIVLPSTLTKVKLKAKYTDGTEVIGESKIPEAQKKIEAISLVPRNAEPLPEALEAIENADLIVLGPGSLYTSVIPNLLVNKICTALAESAALKVYVCNVMTQPGETDQMSASDHIKAIIKHADGRKIFDYALINNQRLTAAQARKYSSENAYPVKPDVNQVKKYDVNPIMAPLLDQGDLVRHDSQALAQALIKLVVESKS